VDSFALNEKAEYRLNDNHKFKGGLRMDYVKVGLDSDSMVLEKEGEISYDHTDLELKINKDFSFFYPTFYMMDQITLGSFTVTPGVHYFKDTYNHHDLIDPRLSVRYNLNKETTLKTAWGIYSQMPQYDEFIEPWGTKGLEPERAVHTVAGIEHYFTDSLYLDIQAYRKTFSNLVVRESADNPTSYSNSGKGKSYGAEIMLRQNMTDRFFGWVSYSYAVAKRTDGNGKPERYFDMDTPHNLVGVLNYKPNRNWSFGVRYQYVSGTPYTDLMNVDTRYDVDNDTYVPLYTGTVNTDRLKSHQQVDFRIDRYWLFDDYVLSTYLDFRNVFQNKYVTSKAYNEDYTASEDVVSVDSEIPLIFVGMKIDF
jgi:outer membrane receptor for Fe3+-dicitrate